MIKYLTSLCLKNKQKPLSYIVALISLFFKKKASAYLFRMFLFSIRLKFVFFPKDREVHIALGVSFQVFQ